MLPHKLAHTVIQYLYKGTGSGCDFNCNGDKMHVKADPMAVSCWGNFNVVRSCIS